MAAVDTSPILAIYPGFLLKFHVTTEVIVMKFRTY